jgi:alkanesulfonate monooxygenase SsuD/methylene tetrahydromethanopterin reductase-like flavin-dependent oxidoreductase (luciferase family)
MRAALRLTRHVHAAGDFPSGSDVVAVALAAEAAGFDAVYVTDHPIPAAQLDARGGHHDLDPFVTLGCAC